MIDKKSGKLNVDWDEELVKAVLLTLDGKIVHSSLAKKPAAKKSAAKKPVAKAKNIEGTMAGKTGSGESGIGEKK